MRGAKVRHVGILLMSAVATWPMAAAAQQVATPPDGAGVSEMEIIVTARKRSERLLDVPAAITAFSGEAMSRYATGSIESLATQAPQVQITRTAAGTGAQVTIRGIGSNSFSDDAIEQSVAFNIDGVPTSRGRAIQQGLFDLGSVQILKGPQALYFGKNSPAGVIVLESNGPGDRLEGYVKAGYEIKAAEYVGEAAMGGPLTETLGLRLAMRGSDMTKGYVRNIGQPISAANNPIAYDRANGLSIPGRDFVWGPGTKTLAGRLTAVWRPTSDFDATLKVFESYYKDQGDSSQTVVLTCPAGAANPATTDLSATPPRVVPDLSQPCPASRQDVRRENSLVSLPDAISAALPDGFSKDTNLSKVRSHLVSLQMNYHAGDFTFSSVSGFYKFRSENASNADTAGLGIIGVNGLERNESWTQELRMVTSFDAPLNFTVAGFYAHDKRSFDFYSFLIRNIDPATGNSATTIGRGDTTGRTLSAFAEATLKLSPELELSGGARYTHDRKRGTVQSIFVSPQATAIRLALPGGTIIPASVSGDNISPQVTVTWHPERNATVYAAYRTGFKAGTISNSSLICACATRENLTLRNEKAHGYEGGLKYQSDDRRFSGEFSIYHYNFDNLQVQAFDASVSSTIALNAGSAQTDGVEFNANYRLTDAVTLRGAGGYNRARYASFVNSSCYSGQTAALGCVAGRQNLTGHPLPRAPKWAGSAGVTYDQPLGNDWVLSTSIDGYYTTGYYPSANNSEISYQKGFGRIDANVRLHEADDRWELAVIVRNLTNKLYVDFASDRALAPAGSTRGSLGAPRTVLLQAGYKF